MGFKPVVLLIAFLSLLLNPYIAALYAHPGGTDSTGGHYNRKTGEYHSHSSKKTSAKINDSWTGKVVGVSDGDTIKVLRNGEQVKIRLYGIDTPEKKQAFGQVAKRYTADFVAGKVVSVEPIDKDRYGRTVALVSANGISLNKELVQNGFAWVYGQYCKKEFCTEWKELEGQARSNRKGLWAESSPQTPWEFRKENSI